MPRWRAASQVRKPVVPEERMRERDSEVIIVLASSVVGSCWTVVVAGSGAVYLIYPNALACSTADGLGCVSRYPQVSMSVSNISYNILINELFYPHIQPYYPRSKKKRTNKRKKVIHPPQDPKSPPPTSPTPSSIPAPDNSPAARAMSRGSLR